MAKWTIASWNINSVRARLDHVLDWLHDRQPDVLCLQETKASDVDFPAEAIREAGYNVAFKGEKSYNGVAIISRSEPDHVHFGLGTKKDPDKSRLIAAVIDGIPVINTYVPQGREVGTDYFEYKLNWFDRILDLLKKNYSPQKSLAWVGDLNIAPEAIDVHDPKRLLGHVAYHPELHRKLARVMDWGLVDAFRMHVPGPGQYTFWDYRVKDAMKKGIGWRVDHIMATKPLAEMSVSAWIDPEPRKAKRPSDHAPIAVEFKLD